MLSYFLFMRRRTKKPFAYYIIKNLNNSKNKPIKSLNNISLRGMTKREITSLFGAGSNDFESDVWYYIIDSTWWQMKTVVVIGFRDDIVEFKFIKIIYGKIIESKLF